MGLCKSKSMSKPHPIAKPGQPKAEYANPASAGCRRSLMSGSSPGADSSLGVSAKFLEMLLANHGDYLDKPTGDFVEGW
mgnify:FL=1